MSFRLVPLTTSTAAPVITLHRPVLLIGRHLECDVRIDLPKISRRHCCLAIAYDRVMIRDLGSRNQVRVNGRVVEEAQLKQGDELAIGPIVYRLELLPDEPKAPGISLPAARRSNSAIQRETGGFASAGVKNRESHPMEDSGEDLIPIDDA